MTNRAARAGKGEHGVDVFGGVERTLRHVDVELRLRRMASERHAGQLHVGCVEPCEAPRRVASEIADVIHPRFGSAPMPPISRRPLFAAGAHYLLLNFGGRLSTKTITSRSAAASGAVMRRYSKGSAERSPRRRRQDRRLRLRVCEVSKPLANSHYAAIGIWNTRLRAPLHSRGFTNSPWTRHSIFRLAQGGARR